MKKKCHTQVNDSTNKMATMPVGKLVLQMALPIIVAMAVHALYNIIDSVFVSRISLDALNAVSLAMPIQRFISAVAIGCAVGINAPLSNSLGREDTVLVRKISGNGIFLALVCSLFFFLFGWFGLKPLIAAQTRNPSTTEYAIKYLRIICIFSFSGFLEVTFERFLIAAGRTSLTMISQIAGTALNVCMDPLFIFVFKLGVSGAALATVLSQFFAMLLSFFLNARFNPEIILSVKALKPEAAVLAGIGKIAVPSVITNLAASFMTFTLNIILYRYTSGKEIAQNVFGIYIKLNALISLPIMGIGNGLIPIIAYNLGKNNTDRIKECFKKSMKFSIVIGLFMTMLFQIVPKPLLAVFMGGAADEEAALMYAAGIPALRIISLSLVFSGIIMTFCSFFQGMGNGVFSAIPALLRQVFILLPVAFVLARIGLSGGNDLAVWYSFLIAEILSVFPAFMLYKKECEKMTLTVSGSMEDADE